MLSIEPYNNQDASTVARLIFSAFVSKFQTAKKLDKEQQWQLFQHIWLWKQTADDSSSKEHAFVVKKDEQVVASFSLLSHTKKATVTTQAAPQKLKFFSLCKTYGSINTIKLLCLFFLLSHVAQKGELYISHVAVVAEAQGMGIGKQIMTYITEYAQQNPTIKYISLHVDPANTNAVKLYEHTGFTMGGKERSLSTLLFLGISDWYYMKKTVPFL